MTSRVGDVAIALALLLLCLPVMVLACLIVWLEAGAAPIRRQERLSRDGRIVRLYRLRTTKATPFGRRFTKSGLILRQWHLDQIPLLLNVLLGELSFLAPDETAREAAGAKRLLALRTVK